MNIGDVIAKLKLDSENFVKGVDEAQTKLQGFVDKSNDGLGSLIETAGKVALGIGAIAVAAATTAFALASNADKNVQAKLTYDALTESAGLAADTLANKLGEAMNGQLTKTETMTLANELMARGLLHTEDQAADLAYTARRLGEAFGVEALTAVNDFGFAIQNQSARGLRQYGIATDDVTNRVEELKAANSELTDQQAFEAAVMDIAHNKVKILGDDYNGLNERVGRIKVGIQNWIQEQGEKLIPVIEKTMDVVGGLFTFIQSGDLTGDFLRALGIAEDSPIATAMVETRDSVIQSIQNIIDGVRQFGEAFGQFVQSPPVQMFLSIMRQIAENIIKNVQAAFDELGKVWNEKIAPALNKLGEALQPLAEKLFPVLGAAIGVVLVVLGKVWEVLTGLLKPAFDVIGAVVGWLIDPIFTGLIKIITAAIDWISNFVKDGIEKWNNFKAAAEFVFNAIKSAIESAFNSAVTTVKNAINSVIWLVNQAIVGINNMIQSVNNATGLQIGLVGSIQYLATGTESFKGGMAVVGEQGAELVSLPDGSSVTPANRTRDLFDMIKSVYENFSNFQYNFASLQGQGGQAIAINIDLSGANISSPEIANEYAEQMADKIAEIGRIKNRAYF